MNCGERSKLFPPKRKRVEMRDKKQVVPVRAASLWLCAHEPFRMDIDEGIGVYEKDGPRLPGWERK